ncbi:hypothetical protein D3C75_726950 [compost metagenome]
MRGREPIRKIDMKKNDDLATCDEVNAARCILSQKAHPPFGGGNKFYKLSEPPSDNAEEALCQLTGLYLGREISTISMPMQHVASWLVTLKTGDCKVWRELTITAMTFKSKPRLINRRQIFFASN